MYTITDLSNIVVAEFRDQECAIYSDCKYHSIDLQVHHSQSDIIEQEKYLQYLLVLLKHSLYDYQKTCFIGTACIMIYLTFNHMVVCHPFGTCYEDREFLKRDYEAYLFSLYLSLVLSSQNIYAQFCQHAFNI